MVTGCGMFCGTGVFGDPAALYSADYQLVNVPYHTRIYPIRVWDVAYAYIHIGCPFAYGMVYCPILVYISMHFNTDMICT